MKNLLFIITILAGGVNILSAQTDVCYTYDAAGNRIKREQCCTNCWLKEEPEKLELSALYPAEGEKLTIIPNPSNGLFTLGGEGIPPTAQVTIMSMTGARVMERHLGNSQFDVSTLPAGIYVVNIQYGDKRKALLLEKIDR